MKAIIHPHEHVLIKQVIIQSNFDLKVLIIQADPHKLINQQLIKYSEAVAT